MENQNKLKNVKIEEGTHKKLKRASVMENVEMYVMATRLIEYGLSAEVKKNEKTKQD